MTYAQFGLVQASDYNGLVGGDPTTTANTLNAVWGQGGVSTKGGYGQTAEANVSAGQVVTAAKWESVRTKTASAGAHNGGTITTVAAFTAGGVVSYSANLQTNINNIYAARLNMSAAASTTTANTATRGTSWTNKLTFTHTATFANANAARYFFNSGGTLRLTCSHPTGTFINGTLSTLATAVGTLAFSSATTETISISSSSLTGFTKIGGSGSPSVNLTTQGFYNFGTANANTFLQTAGGAGEYSGSFINVLVAADAAVSGGTATVLTFYTDWDISPDGGGPEGTATSGTATTLTAFFPETTNLANSWGAVTLAGSVSGT